MIALFIGRFQPFHAGHLDALKQILGDPSTNSGQVIIGVGSSQYSGTDENPYSFAERKKMIELAIKNFKNKNFKIIAVPDIHDPPNWVEHVEKIVGKFDLVYTGNKFTAKLFKEKKYMVKNIKKRINISGTTLRKQEKIQKYFNQKEKLSLQNPNYKKQVEILIKFLLKEDLGKAGDITSNLLIKNNETAKGIIFSKQNGIVSGLEEAYWIAQKYQLSPTLFKKDGEKIKKGEKLIKLHGSIKNILKTERLLINILGRMSGIATQTKKFSNQKNFLICATRKTLWGLMDKKAVTVGGGGTHRLGLYDFILIKENHLKFNKNIEKQIEKIKKQNKFWEIEVENKKELLWAVNLNPDAIMLDNFSPKEIINNKKILKKYPQIIWEASGGITAENISQYQKTEVDIISLGSLTHSAKSLDISLDII